MTVTSGSSPEHQALAGELPQVLNAVEHAIGLIDDLDGSAAEARQWTADVLALVGLLASFGTGEFSQASADIASALVDQPAQPTAVWRYTLLMKLQRLHRLVRQGLAPAGAPEPLPMPPELQQRVLREREALNQHAIVSVADRQGRIVDCNERFCAISGYTRAELLGQRHSLLKSGRHPEAFYAEMWRCLRAGQVWQGVICNRRKDGAYYWVQSTICPQLDAEGVLQEYVSIRTDVTHLKQAEERLALFSRVLGASTSSVVLIDVCAPGHPVSLANPAFAALCGMPVAELIGQPFGSPADAPADPDPAAGAAPTGEGAGAVPRRDQAGAAGLQARPGDGRIPAGTAGPRPLPAMRRLLGQGRPGRHLVQDVRADGSRCELSLRLSQVTDEHGVTTHHLALIDDITHQRRAEQALQESDDRWQRSQAYAQVGSWEWRLDTGNMRWSEQASALLGLEPLARVASREHLLNLVHPLDRRAVAQALEDCLQRGAPFEVQHRCVWADGNLHWLQQRGDLVRDARGQPLRMVGVVLDITAQRQAELALADSRARLAAACRQARLGHWEVDLNTGEGHWCEITRELLGLSPHRHGRTTLGDFAKRVHVDDVDAFDQAVQDAIGQGQADIDHRVVLDGGEVRHLHAHLRVGSDENGVPCTLGGTLQDISERERAKQQAALFSQVFDRADQGIVLADGHGQVQDANPAALRLLRSGRSAVMGANVLGWLRPEVIQALQAKAAAPAAKAPAWQGPTTLDGLATGRVSEVHLSAGWLREPTAGGQPLMYLVFRDHADQARLLDALRQARDQAEQANRAKTAFLSHMSHELRTPLNAVIGFAQMLALDQAAAPTRTGSPDGIGRAGSPGVEPVQEILRAGQHLLALINEVLDLARVESGPGHGQLEDLGLDELLADCLGLMQPDAAARGITLHPLPPGGAWVRADRLRLRQVLLNLLSNAIKYNRPQGQVTLQVRRVADHAVIDVSDTGPGLTPEELARLFTPYHRGAAEAGPVVGSGLGLAISRQLALSMGGELSVASTPGAGCCFSLRLPRVAAPAAGPVQPAAPPAATALAQWPPALARRTAGRPARVLYIEDNPANLALMQELFSLRPQWTLQTARTAAEGGRLARAHRPDLLLLDIHLPDGNGLDLLHTLRAEDGWQQVPAVAVTAGALGRDLQREQRAGLHRHLAKPLDLGELLATLDELLDGPPASGAAPP